METIGNWVQAIQGHDQFNAENMFDMIVVLGKGVFWRLEPLLDSCFNFFMFCTK